MLRVESSNLPSPRTTPRSRRLLANPGAPRRAVSHSRHEILPPRDPEAATRVAQPLAAPTPPLAASERWIVRLELVDDDVARLYGQGLARGALVWKKGMVEWRPLLITPELTSLLRRTRTTLIESSPPQEPSEPVTAPRLPAPARMPSEMTFSTTESGRRVPLTVSPLAIDVQPPAPVSSRRRFEVTGAALAGFALAWFAHAGLTPEPASPMSMQLAAAQPSPVSPAPAAPAATQAAVSSIPLVSLSDLPLLGAAGSRPPSSGGVARSVKQASHTGDGPARAELLGALSRVANAASGCGERGGPVRVVITFANSGVARGIQVSGSDLPTSTRACIIGAASRARVGAFTGPTVTVSKSL